MSSSLSRRDLFVPPGATPAAGDVSEPIHIASLLVQIVPAQLEALRAAIARMPGAEIHVTPNPSRFAVVLEASDERALADATAVVSAVPGVLTVSIVAHLTDGAVAEADGAVAEDPEWA